MTERPDKHDATGMAVVISYDVAHDRSRAKLAALLQHFGVRIEKSVFDCRLGDGDLADILARASTLIDPDTDTLHVFPTCNRCREGRRALGQDRAQLDEWYWVI